VILNVAGYRFVALEGLEEKRARLLAAGLDAGIKGTILLAPEGVNLFLAGAPAAVDGVLEAVANTLEIKPLAVKRSISERVPFVRYKVKLKREIVPLGDANLAPCAHPAPSVDPLTLKRWIDDGRELVLLDTRNRFEIARGTFKNAVGLEIDDFRSFPAAIAERLDAWKGHTIVSFCTGGIRCEKAAPLMKELGFEDVWQLEGGILNYFEQTGGAHFSGDCTVFDDRVAVNRELASVAEIAGSSGHQLD
jgi:UPF0176 protein